VSASVTPSAAQVPGCLRGFPGIVVRVSPVGVVLESNGRLESALGGAAVLGHPLTDALDGPSCRAKWERLLAAAPGAPDGCVAELVLTGRDTLPEPRAFSVLWDPDVRGVWLVEHPRDERLDRLREQVTDVNSELANTQRDLLKERSRLARALAELETRNAELEATSLDLARSNRALDEFAHVVSHDLKTPLRSIANYAHWVTEDAGDLLSGEPRSHLDALRGQVDRMRAMIDGALEYARAGRERRAPETVDVGALLREIVALLHPPPHVVVEADGALPTLHTARAPLQQVLQNLVDNAIKHARRDDARVRVRARPTHDWYEFAVADNGPGIPARSQERIWALFHTLEPSRGTENTGIGLAVVRRLVEAHGGRVWVESSAAGATFHFLWPAHSEERGSGG
jgi:signal transduction histidine kinase